MRKVDCDICDNKQVALNETLKVDKQIYCNSCLETHFADQGKLEGRLVEQELDPTICSSCNVDFGSKELNKVSRYPFCPECEVKLKNRTFPLWVKGFFVGILAIVLVGFAWNWKYYEAYKNLNKSYEVFQTGDFASASALASSASGAVPEVQDLKTLASYFRGYDLLMKDKNEEALVSFNYCMGKIPDEYNLSTLIIQAKLGIDFNSKDYDKFLADSKELLTIDSTSAANLAGMASAYACIYAERGDEEVKANAISYLARSKEIDGTSDGAKEYINRIEHRIETRNIITRDEFLKLYPNGWTKN